LNALKGYKTLAFGAFVAVAPAALTYLGGIDWTTLGISPATAGMIGMAIMGLRFITNSPVPLLPVKVS